MSKKAIVGGLLMVCLLLVGIFGDVTMNGKVVENKVTAVLIAIVIFPTFILLIGFIFGFLKDSLIALFRELKERVMKKESVPPPQA